MRAEDAAKAAVKEAKDNAGVFKTWLALLKGEHSQAGAHSSDTAAVASIQALANKCQTQIGQSKNSNFFIVSTLSLWRCSSNENGIEKIRIRSIFRLGS